MLEFAKFSDKNPFKGKANSLRYDIKNYIKVGDVFTDNWNDEFEIIKILSDEVVVKDNSSMYDDISHIPLENIYDMISDNVEFKLRTLGL